VESRYAWQLPSPDAHVEEAAAALVHVLDLPLPVARLLCRRGYDQRDAVEKLLAPRSEHLLDPFLMADMQSAVARLARAVQAGERIVVNGDYDADGVTGTALLVSELRALGARVDFFIPDRERDGYGITPRLVQRAGEVGLEVLLSVDCGSSDGATIAAARALGIDVIVVDHHEIPERPAAACAVLNPKRADCGYPFKSLAAVGVAYKLLQALGSVLGREPAGGLDLVALGTLADVQTVVGENRALVSLGLASLAREPRPGIQALCDVAGMGGEAVRSWQVGFRLAPRLNAVGRVARGKLAVDLLLAADASSAGVLALQIEVQNRRRQQLGQDVTQEALQRAEEVQRERADVAALVLASPGWHPGVIGIAAARLVDRFGMPTALIGIQNEVGRGSVRTAGGLDVKAVLDEVSDLLLKYGGHREAAGFSIEPRHVATFAARFETAVRERGRSAGARTLCVDVELQADDLRRSLTDALERLEPYGVGHPEPLFLVRGLRAGSRTRIVGQDHLKLELRGEDGRVLDGIGFGWAERLPPAAAIGQDLDVVAWVRKQDPRWGGEVQLVIADLRSHAGGASVPEQS